MNAFVFALNCVMPIVLLAAVGFFVRKLGWISQSFVDGTDKLTFNLFVPVLLFMNIYHTTGIGDIQWDVVLYCCIVSVLAFLFAVFVVAPTIKDRSRKSAILQTIYRSNFAIIGLPLATGIYGDAGAQMAAVLSLFVIPLFNVLTVFGLSLYTHAENERINWGSVLKKTISNPLILGVVAGFAALLLRYLLERAGIAFRLTDIVPVYKTIEYMADVASPLAIISLGASFEFAVIKGMTKEIITGTVCRLVLAPLVFIGGACLLFPNWSGAVYAAMVGLFASPVAVTSVVYVANMGGDKKLASQLVVWTTVLSTFTVFLTVLALKSFGFLM